MKLQFRDIEPFAKNPPASALAVLVYGPDEGLVRERLDLLTKSVVEDIRDPFNVVEFSGDALADNPARLLDEARSISMLGGRRVVRLRDATEKCAGAVKSALDGLKDGDNLVLVEAGNLAPKDKLRALFEGAKNAAALPCYVDDARSVSRVIADSFRAAGYACSGDALAHIAANVSGDRAVARSEAEKLVTYMGENKRITLDDAVAATGNSAVMSLEDLAQCVAAGNFAQADRILVHVYSEGVEPVRVLRALQNHFLRLHVTKARLQQGLDTETALKMLKPAVFWKVKDSFVAQLNGWSATQMEQALGALLEAEARCKRSGGVPETLCARAVLSLSQLGARINRRRGYPH
ncbi:MAG: DNA polymerase III subunit delta [Alphaproteobacteria bacterium]|nr:DNA polymerase III subunit delta [Alphaproteobacteria bacterium]MDE2337096.1 DNA polymerase III subunit delta [Alphaproteobacteria bacterium]